MKKTYYLLLFSLFAIGCKTNQISNQEREKLVEELEYINKIDQEYAGIPSQEFKEKYGNEKAWEIFVNKRDSIALDNQSKIKEMYRKYGFLGYSQVGEKASGNFWIVIQHADNDVKFQKKMLKSMQKEVLKNNADKADFALLEDRVNVNLGKKQRFGTQLTYNEKQQATPKNGLIDSANIDMLRKEYNLEPYKDYLNEMTQDHFEMNKDMFIKMGITEPNLYE